MCFILYSPFVGAGEYPAQLGGLLFVAFFHQKMFFYVLSDTFCCSVEWWRKDMDSLRALKARGEDLLVFGSAVGTCLQPRSPK